jgi:hypothetical protein
MKKSLSGFLLTLLVFIGCKGKSDKQVTENDTLVARSLYSWESVLNDSSGRLEMKKTENAGPDSLTAGSVISFLNRTNPDIQLQLIKQSNDTLYINIPEAEHLTQRMGSTGPTMYFASAVYNLTEVPGIKYVNFDFSEGDHASPGVYERDSFKDE